MWVAHVCLSSFHERPICICVITHAVGWKWNTSSTVIKLQSVFSANLDSSLIDAFSIRRAERDTMQAYHQLEQEETSKNKSPILKQINSEINYAGSLMLGDYRNRRWNQTNCGTQPSWMRGWEVELLCAQWKTTDAHAVYSWVPADLCGDAVDDAN